MKSCSAVCAGINAFTRASGDTVNLDIETMVVAEEGEVIPDVLPTDLIETIKADTAQVIVAELATVIETAAKVIEEETGVVVAILPTVEDVVVQEVVKRTAAPTISPAPTIPAPTPSTPLDNLKFITSDFNFGQNRKFCVQIMNFREGARFKMRPCKWRTKQVWRFDSENGKIRNKAFPSWCITWKGKKKELRLTKCKRMAKNRKIEYNSAEKAIIVTNLYNNKKFFVGFNPRKKFNFLRLYGIKNRKNPSVHSFLLE